MVGSIRIYDYEKGKLIKILKSHANVVLDLAFSKDGRYLISGSGDKTAKIWDVKKDFKLQDTIYFHKSYVYAVKIIIKEKKYFAVSAGYDNTIALYDIQKREVINSHSLNYRLQYLANNLTSKHIAVCGKAKKINIYNYNLNLIKTIHSDTKPTGLSYSKDGKYLIAGTGTHPLNINIYITTNYKLYSSFKKHKNLVQAVGFFKDGKKTYGVSGGGNNYGIYVWDTKTLKVKTKIVGVGHKVLSVGVDGEKIAWGNKFQPVNHNNRGPLQRLINLKTLKIQNVNTQQFRRISTINATYSLMRTKGGKYGYNGGVLLIQKNNQTVAKIVKNATNGYRHNCFGWYKDYIISGGMNGQLKIYNKNGDEVASLIGHTGEVWSIAVEGDRLVSGSDDQTIRVCDLSK
jgi:WD40 repeat protein